MNLEEALNEIDKAGDDHLYILWTSGDVTTAKLMVFMYAENALKRGWWDKITVIIWGAATKLTAENEEIQEKIASMKECGVQFTGCIACAKELDVANEITNLGIELLPWGPLLTKVMKENKKLLTV